MANYNVALGTTYVLSRRSSFIFLYPLIHRQICSIAITGETRRFTLLKAPILWIS